MRYTTLIDIREDPLLYRNHNIRLVYLHLVLVAGYHDENRDIVRCSLRRLSSDIGCSMSALRHALKVLAKAKLVSTRKDGIMVIKYVPEKKISKRTSINPASGQPIDHKAKLPDFTNGRPQIIAAAASGDKRAIEICTRFKWNYKTEQT